MEDIIWFSERQVVLIGVGINLLSNEMRHGSLFAVTSGLCGSKRSLKR
jgi:hypothetical protein